MWKISIQYPVPGFELTTFWLWVSSLNHYTRAPAQNQQLCNKVFTRDLLLMTVGNDCEASIF